MNQLSKDILYHYTNGPTSNSERSMFRQINEIDYPLWVLRESLGEFKDVSTIDEFFERCRKSAEDYELNDRRITESNVFVGFALYLRFKVFPVILTIFGAIIFFRVTMAAFNVLWVWGDNCDPDRLTMALQAGFLFKYQEKLRWNQICDDLMKG